MYQADPSPVAYRHGGNWFRRTEDWLDARGRKAWIIAMVLAFIVFWPLGLARSTVFIVVLHPASNRPVASRETCRQDFSVGVFIVLGSAYFNFICETNIGPLAETERT